MSDQIVRKCPHCGNMTTGVFKPSTIRKFATNIAKKGGMKAVLTAAGSVIPGFGNVAGFITGSAIDALAGDKINQYIDDTADEFESEKTYYFTCPKCGHQWNIQEEQPATLVQGLGKALLGGITTSTSVSETQADGTSINDEQTRFNEVLDEVLSKAHEIVNVKQLRKVGNKLLTDSKNVSNPVVSSEYIAVAAVLAIEYTLDHYTDLDNSNDLQSVLSAATDDIKLCLDILPDDPEYLLIQDSLLSLYNRETQVQLKLGDWVPYLEEDFGNSIFRYEYLLHLYEWSRYLVIRDLAKQARERNDKVTEEKLWKLLVSYFHNVNILINANIHLYLLHMGDETSSGKLSTSANRFLTVGYGLMDFETAVNEQVEEWLFIAEEYANALAHGTLLSERQNFQEGFSLLQKISQVDFSCPAKYYSNISLGNIYEVGEYVPQDLSQALLYYKKSGDEENISRVMQLIREQGLSENSSHSASKSIILQSENEKEYIAEVKACIEEDGEISKGERRLLEKLRIKLEISKEHAAELEKSLLYPQLTDEEQEYLAEYKGCLAEGGEISAGERRLLNRLRNKLGISEQRAYELEQID